MEPEPSLSVVIPVFQSIETIERALCSIDDANESLLAKGTTLPITVITVFDGDDPPTRTLIESLKHQLSVPVSVLVKDHSGVSDTRNFGLKTAISSHITFLDADDEITPERILVTTRCRDQILVGRQHIVFDTDSPRPAGVGPQANGPNHYFTSLVAPVWRIIELGGFDPSLHYGADVDLVIRARDNGHPVLLVDDVTTIRHVTGRNVSLNVVAARRDLLHSLTRRNLLT
jgi:glycosyltransferase involved in cell wall biosynthesis